MSAGRGRLIQMVPLDRIAVLNPRARPRVDLDKLASSIAAVGLKEPITVARRVNGSETSYEVACGEGRYLAFKILGQATIPAFVVDADEKECLLKSLIENCARRKHSAIELFRDIKRFKESGATAKDIAKKTGLNYHYVLDLLKLISRGEERLLQAVESGHIPITVAVEIAEADDTQIQKIFHDAYQKNLLRGEKLRRARELVARRMRRGKHFERKGEQKVITPNSMLRDYRRNADRQRLLIRKATVTRDRLLLVTQALRTLYADENFINLLRAETLDTLPKSLANRIHGQEN